MATDDQNADSGSCGCGCLCALAVGFFWLCDAVSSGRVDGSTVVLCLLCCVIFGMLFVGVGLAATPNAPPKKDAKTEENAVCANAAKSDAPPKKDDSNAGCLLLAVGVLATTAFALVCSLKDGSMIVGDRAFWLYNAIAWAAAFAAIELTRGSRRRAALKRDPSAEPKEDVRVGCGCVCFGVCAAGLWTLIASCADGRLKFGDLDFSGYCALCVASAVLGFERFRSLRAETKAASKETGEKGKTGETRRTAKIEKKEEIAKTEKMEKRVANDDRQAKRLARYDRKPRI